MLKNKPLELMGVREVSEFLGVSKQYVDRLVKKEEINPITQLHCGRIFMKEDIVKFNNTRRKIKQKN